MHDTRNATLLQCNFADFQRADGYTGLKDLARQQKRVSRLFELVDGGMKLSTVVKSINASQVLDRFVVSELEVYRNPDTRQFGENLFSVIGSEGNYRLGHTERYCGSALRMSVKELKAKSGGNIAAVAHTHPYFHHLSDARQRNREGAQFGPGDWTPLVALHVPVFLYSPLGQVSVMEYDGAFVTVRKIRGRAAKWRVSSS
jgi:hypothetical protein